MSDRTAVKARKTKETDLSVSINLDGTGQADISTGLPFLTICSNKLPGTGFLT